MGCKKKTENKNVFEKYSNLSQLTPWQENANYVYNSFLQYELSVLKKYALPLLVSIKKDDEYFPMAERLIRLLKHFVDMDDSVVPNNSLIREFIGGSVYESML